MDISDNEPKKQTLVVIDGGRQPKQEVLEELNQSYALIENYGGRTVVMNLDTRSPMRPTDFSTAKGNIRFQSGKKSRSIGSLWLEWAGRRTYSKVVFNPSSDANPTEYNLWKGLATSPEWGDCDLIFKHIFDILSNGNKEANDYIIKWLAWVVQNPGRMPETTLVFLGPEGAGKGILGRLMANTIFGVHGLHASHSSDLVGRFSAHLEYICFLFADEACFTTDAAAGRSLLARITEPTLLIERKGYDKFSVANHLACMMASNLDWVVPASSNSRRHSIFYVSHKYASPEGSLPDEEKEACRIANEAYFKALASQIENGGAQAFLYSLLNADLADFHPRQNFENEALQEQREQTSCDTWNDAADDWLSLKLTTPTSISTKELLTEAISMPVERQNRAAEMRAGKVLKDHLKWIKKNWTVEGKPRSWRYWDPNSEAFKQQQTVESQRKLK